jgi:membrane fusion protein (multidrug efflux system)
MLVASLAIMIAISAARLVCDSVLYERTNDAQIDGHITPVSARINGQVQQVNIIEGQLVRAGDVLVVMDRTECSIAVNQAMANVAYAQNTAASLYFNAAITVTSAYGGLNSARAAVKNAELEVVTAEHKSKADEAVLKQAQADATTMEAILDATAMETVLVADQQVLIQTQEKLGQAITNLRAAQTAPEQVSIARVKAQAADSQIMESQSQLEQAQLKLSYTILRSPVTGIIGKRRVEVGQTVSAGQELMDVVSLDDVWITANFKEAQFGHLRPGQPVEIKVDAYGRTWKGHITNLGGATGSVLSLMPSNAVGNHGDLQRVRVRIDFDRPQSPDFNAADLLKPGLSVKPEVRVRWLPRAPSPPERPQLDSEGGSNSASTI